MLHSQLPSSRLYNLGIHFVLVSMIASRTSWHLGLVLPVHVLLLLLLRLQALFTCWVFPDRQPLSLSTVCVRGLLYGGWCGLAGLYKVWGGPWGRGLHWGAVREEWRPSCRRPRLHREVPQEESTGYPTQMLGCIQCIVEPLVLR